MATSIPDKITVYSMLKDRSHCPHCDICPLLDKVFHKCYPGVHTRRKGKSLPHGGHHTYS